MADTRVENLPNAKGGDEFDKGFFVQQQSGLPRKLTGSDLTSFAAGTIVKGQKGQRGDQGPEGEKGEVGEAGDIAENVYGPVLATLNPTQAIFNSSLHWSGSTGFTITAAGTTAQVTQSLDSTSGSENQLEVENNVPDDGSMLFVFLSYTTASGAEPFDIIQFTLGPAGTDRNLHFGSGVSVRVNAQQNSLTGAPYFTLTVDSARSVFPAGSRIDFLYMRPVGAKGDKGDTGSAGVKGATGAVTIANTISPVVAVASGFPSTGATFGAAITSDVWAVTNPFPAGLGDAPEKSATGYILMPRASPDDATNEVRLSGRVGNGPIIDQMTINWGPSVDTQDASRPTLDFGIHGGAGTYLIVNVVRATASDGTDAAGKMKISFASATATLPSNARVVLEYIRSVGERGEAGAEGAKGDQGIKGDVGPKGIQGDLGPRGSDGSQGDKGEAGAKGEVGEKGEVGSKGSTGDKGNMGDRGIKGDIGNTGLKGDRGDAGPQGPQGVKGDQGDQGNTGIAGDKGDKGEAGLPVNPIGGMIASSTFVVPPSSSPDGGTQPATVSLPAWSRGARTDNADYRLYYPLSGTKLGMRSNRRSDEVEGLAVSLSGSGSGASESFAYIPFGRVVSDQSLTITPSSGNGLVTVFFSVSSPTPSTRGPLEDGNTATPAVLQISTTTLQSGHYTSTHRGGPGESVVVRVYEWLGSGPGEQGDKGDPGAKGEPGSVGPKGAAGGAATPGSSRGALWATSATFGGPQGDFHATWTSPSDAPTAPRFDDNTVLVIPARPEIGVGGSTAVDTTVIGIWVILEVSGQEDVAVLIPYGGGEASSSGGSDIKSIRLASGAYINASLTAENSSTNLHLRVSGAWTNNLAVNQYRLRVYAAQATGEKGSPGEKGAPGEKGTVANALTLSPVVVANGMTRVVLQRDATVNTSTTHYVRFDDLEQRLLVLPATVSTIQLRNSLPPRGWHFDLYNVRNSQLTYEVQVVDPGPDLRWHAEDWDANARPNDILRITSDGDRTLWRKLLTSHQPHEVDAVTGRSPSLPAAYAIEDWAETFQVTCRIKYTPSSGNPIYRYFQFTTFKDTLLGSAGDVRVNAWQPYMIQSPNPRNTGPLENDLLIVEVRYNNTGSDNLLEVRLDSNFGFNVPNYTVTFEVDNVFMA